MSHTVGQRAYREKRGSDFCWVWILEGKGKTWDDPLFVALHLFFFFFFSFCAFHAANFPSTTSPITTSNDKMATTSTARPTPSSSSLASSMTRTEADVQSLSSQRTKVNHFKLVFDPAGVTPESLQWRYGGHGTTEDPYAVDFTPQDPYNPQEFTRTKKWVLTILTAFSTLAVAFASSAFSSGLESIILEFGVSEELSILGLSMFVVGFAVGPLLWAPLSGESWPCTDYCNPWFPCVDLPTHAFYRILRTTASLFLHLCRLGRFQRRWRWSPEFSCSGRPALLCRSARQLAAHQFRGCYRRYVQPV